MYHIHTCISQSKPLTISSCPTQLIFLVSKYIYRLKVINLGIEKNHTHTCADTHTALSLFLLKRFIILLFHCWIIQVHRLENSGHILIYPWSLISLLRYHLLRKVSFTTPSFSIVFSPLPTYISTSHLYHYFKLHYLFVHLFLFYTCH